MCYAERRTIEELVAQYELEQSTRDVIVEGVSDSNLVNWFAINHCTGSTLIIEIDAIEVPSDLVKNYDLPVSNRGRVLALAHFLDETLNGTSRDCVTLIIDADCDNLLSISWDIDFLLTTDFTCFEMYLFDEDIFNKLISVVLGVRSITASTGLPALARVLQRLWLIKITNQVLDYSMSWINFNKICKVSGCNIKFDENKFITRYLTKNGKNGNKKQFIKKLDELTSKIDPDPRHSMDGHHFMELTRWYLRRFAKNRKPLTDQRAFDSTYFACIELSHLDEFDLFQRIKDRVSHS